jgi:hypothetical protein
MVPTSFQALAISARSQSCCYRNRRAVAFESLRAYRGAWCKGRGLYRWFQQLKSYVDQIQKSTPDLVVLGIGFVRIKPLLLLGEASYAIYLVQISILCHIFFRFRIGHSSTELIFCFIFAAAIACGVLAYFLIERSLIELIRRGKLGRVRIAVRLGDV